MRKFVRVVAVIGSVAAAAVLSTAARAGDPAGAAQTPPPPPPARSQSAPKAPPPRGTPAPSAPQAPAAPQAPGGAQTQEKASSEAHGIVQMIDDALQGVQLRPDQADAFKSLATDVDTKVAAVDQAKRDFLLALSDEVESGRVDASSLQPKIQSFVDASAAASPVVRHGLEKIHDMLDPQQRQQFVTNFRDELRKTRPTLDTKASIDKWAQALKLSDDQKQKISSALEEDKIANEVAHDRLRLVLDAFQEDTFSMDDLLPADSIRGRAEKLANRIVDVTSRVSDVLTPEQRKTAAETIRTHVQGRSTGEPGQETGATGTEKGTTGTEKGTTETDTTSEPLWAGRGYRVGYRGYTGYGFARGYGLGYGGVYLL